MKRIRIAAMSRAAGVIAASLLMVGVAAVSPAAADPPDITRYPDYGTTYVFPDPVNGYASRCEFPVMVQDEGKGIEIAFADGRFFGAAPGLRGTVTNLETGKSIDLTVNGSVHISPLTPVGTQGHSLEVMRFTGPLVDLSPGQLTWYTGQTVVVIEYDEFGDVVTQGITSHTGRSLDVCAALAP
jgi:hypothetical protein